MEETTTKTQTQELTLQFQTHDNEDIVACTRPQPSSPQTFDRCSPAPPGATSSPMNQHALELGVLFEDHGVCSRTVTDYLGLEHMVYEQRALVQPPPTALQLTGKEEFSFHSVSQSPEHSWPKPVNLHWFGPGMRRSSPTKLQASPSTTTSLPWPSTSTSSCTLLRSRGNLARRQRYFCNGNLMTSQNSVMATRFTRSYTGNSGCCNSW